MAKYERDPVDRDCGLRDFTGARFRANPNYQLIQFDRLPEELRGQMGVAAGQPGFYGLLLPSQDGLTPKTACEDTALLLYTLAEPGPLPSYVRSKFGEDTVEAIAELVLDGVLEISAGIDGPFVSGAEACSLLFEPTVSNAPAPRLVRLTEEALRYGAQLRTLNPGELSSRLYTYNAETKTPERGRAFAQAPGVLSFLRLTGSAKSAVNRRGWRLIDDPADGWIFFAGERAGQSPYKLYVSPVFDELPRVFGAIVEAIVSSRAMAFKVGSELTGLLRADKIVAYCENFEDLAVLGETLSKRLDGCSARGVPFTAQIDQEGLLSWGMDPPRENQSVGIEHRESWRLWLTNRLAVSLRESRGSTDAAGATRFALERVRLEGVDIVTWTPKQAIWRTT